MARGADEQPGITAHVAPTGHLVVRCAGARFGLPQAEEVARLADTRFPDGKPQVIVNLANVEYIDSTAVALFVRLSLEGDVRLCGLSPGVAGVMRKMEILALLRVHENERDALAED
jgi:anti-anti-sigma factor